MNSPIFWSSSHANLYRRREISQNIMPVGISRRRTAMTLVNDNEVEEISGKLFVIIVSFFTVASARLELLIQPKEYLFGGIDILIINFLHGFRERLEVLPHCLVNQNVAVS